MMFSRATENGFTIITVLILMLMASVAVIHSLKDNIIQERLSGNFQKNINARLLSEKGIFDTHDTLNQILKNNSTISIADLIVQANNGSISGAGSLSNTGFQVTISDSGTGEIELTSIGERYEGENTLRATFTKIEGGNVSPFTDAVIGCEGVTLNGSGTIDSYDSANGAYSQAIAEREGDVSTIDPNSDVDLNGHSPIYGDVQSTGGVNLGGSSPVYGNVHATGDVFINQSIVDGYVWAVGGYELKGGSVTEYVRANDYAKMGWGATIQNVNNFGLDIMYGGTHKFKDTTNNSHYSDPQYQINPNVSPVPEYDPTAPDYSPTDPATNCDPIDIASQAAVVLAESHSMSPLSIGATQSYELTPNQGKYTANGSTVINSVTSDIFGNASTQAFHVSSFKLTSDATMRVTGGDVVLFVDGDFSISGNAKLTIDADSSLTLILTGKFSVAGSGQIIANQHGLTSTDNPALSIYSSYSGVNGVSISGSSDIYAAIYAPLTDVKVVGSGAVYGSVRAKTATASGGGGIHFDQALRNARSGNLGGAESRLVLKSLSYY